MKNFNSKRKGFTIVELVIVIAVIGILAAILIPTFVNMSKKANMSADQQAVRQMNMVLAGEDFDTIEEAVSALSKAGYNALDSLVPVTTDHTFWWLEEYNSIVLINENNEVVFGSNKDAIDKFSDALKAGKAFNLKRGLAKVEVTSDESIKNAISKGQSVTLKSDLTITSEIVVNKGEDVVIDLGGYTLSTEIAGGKHEYGFDNHGNVTVRNGTIEARGVENRGLLVIEDGVTIKAIDDNGGACIWNYASGEVIVNGGTFTTTSGDKADTTLNDALKYEPGVINNSGKMTIKGGTYTALETGCYLINNSGTLTIDNGTFTAWRGVVSTVGGNVTINAGTFEKTGTTNTGQVFYVGSGSITVNENAKVKVADTEYDFSTINWTGNVFAGKVESKDETKVVLKAKS